VSNLPSPSGGLSFGGQAPGYGSLGGNSATQATQQAPTNAPAGSLKSYDLLFAALHPFSWKEVSLPYTNATAKLRQDLAPHKMTNRDGAYVEGTGRAPLEFTFRIPLLNGISPAPSEQWQKPLYPYTWRLLLNACMTGTTGTLVQPELGPITCKCQSFDTVWDGNVRSGVWCDLVLLETDESSVDALSQALETPSPAANVAAFAADLDQQVAQVSPAVSAAFAGSFQPQFSFGALAQFALAVTSLPTLLSAQYGGQLAAVVAQANQVSAAFNAQGSASCLNWPALESAQQLMSAAYDQQQVQQTSGKTVLFYTTPQDMTLGQVAGALGQDPTQVMLLNPGYVSSPVVPQGSQVRYYAPSSS
jgi:hypothetical protein